MIKKIIFLSFIILVTSGYQNISMAMELNNNEVCCMNYMDLCVKVKKDGSAIVQIFSKADKSVQDSKGKEQKDLEKELKQLMEEMKRLEKKVKESIRREILPFIRREIEKLRKWLREIQPDNKPEPRKTRIEHA